MIRIATLGIATLAGVLLNAASTEAQVFIRAPFVRVEVGPGVYVRAPFVNLYVPPPGPPVYVYPPGVQVVPQPGGFSVPGQPALPPGVAPPPMKPASGTPNADVNPPLPPPQVLPQGRDDVPPPSPVAQGKDSVPPPPVPLQTKVPSLQEFARIFQARAGTFDVMIVNPVTNQPTPVRFVLPEGTPRRVLVEPNAVEFRYGLLQWVRIQFDKDGATVTLRSRPE